MRILCGIEQGRSQKKSERNRPHFSFLQGSHVIHINHGHFSYLITHYRHYVYHSRISLSHSGQKSENCCHKHYAKSDRSGSAHGFNQLFDSTDQFVVYKKLDHFICRNARYQRKDTRYRKNSRRRFQYSGSSFTVQANCYCSYQYSKI